MHKNFNNSNELFNLEKKIFGKVSNIGYFISWIFREITQLPWNFPTILLIINYYSMFRPPIVNYSEIIFHDQWTDRGKFSRVSGLTMKIFPRSVHFIVFLLFLMISWKHLKYAENDSDTVKSDPQGRKVPFKVCRITRGT